MGNRLTLLGVIAAALSLPLNAQDVPAGQDPKPEEGAAPTGLRVREIDGGYRVTEGDTPVLVYRRDPVAHVDGSHARGHYVHPLWGLDGQRMTDDMPKDHLHHRGLFWAWSQLWVGELPIGQPWEQRDVSWDVQDVKVGHEAGSVHLKATVAWRSPLWVDERGRQPAIIEEVALIRVHPIHDDARAIDFEISLLAQTDAVRLGGSTNTKGYGGFSVRIPLPDDLRIEGPDGVLEPDWTRPTRPAPWVDFSAAFAGGPAESGLTILCHPTTPGFPQGWTIRRQGSCQNPVYPGQHPVDLRTERPLVLRYRVVLHRDGFDAERMAGFFADYARPEK